MSQHASEFALAIYGIINSKTLDRGFKDQAPEDQES